MKLSRDVAWIRSVRRGTFIACEEEAQTEACSGVMLMEEDDSDDREVAALHRRIE